MKGLLDSIKQNLDKEAIKLLSFFPTYLLMFAFIEKINLSTGYHLIHSRLDDLIPFSEWFIIAYVSWYAVTVIIVIRALIYYNEGYRKLIHYMIITSIVCLFAFLLYPSYQDLRPETFENNNLLTMVVGFIYSVDTPTNICPSMHVLGCIGLMYTVIDKKYPAGKLKKTAVCAWLLIICMSTVVLKQHSVIDVLVAIPVGIASWELCLFIFKEKYYIPRKNTISYHVKKLKKAPVKQKL